ncbi:MAG TPA: RecQ family ATP-dependent DNA helicase, partial [Fibrobacteria bacterium]|nr:RecQ family ATP-dependent DNA helicase [Fibrobacteria bacterium]
MPPSPTPARGGGHAVSEAELLDALRHTFGFAGFRPHQREIVESLLAGQDVFAVMPTGGGKSLCYQLPARILPGTAVVISPLIALMKDQVDAARENNIRAACLNSALAAGEAAKVYRALRAGDLDLLYISPERFAMDSFLETLRGAPIAFFAVDEAHCLSEWGHDFRPDYLALGGTSGIRRNFPDTPIAAFTATATSEVGRDIVRKLDLVDPFQVRASFNRPNLFYEVRPKREVDEQILGFLKEHPEEPGIVYRTTRDSVERTAAALAKKGVRALPYHAGLPQEERERNQEAFSRDEAQIVVATIAFGMGIDKSNVRFVIHADLPKNLEGYYQETGRAGRDGDPSLCVLFYGGGDVPKLRFFLEQIGDERERTLAVRKLNQMAAFASRNLCRRRQILAYFEEEYPDPNCGACDICTGRAATLDATREAQMALSAVARTGERFGAGHVVDVLVGADTQKIRELGHDRVKTYGVGKHKDKSWWRS